MFFTSKTSKLCKFAVKLTDPVKVRRYISHTFPQSSKRVRVRFAPSPTGFLHLGGFRTALVNYIFALKYDGKFILRIEDTDRTRLVPGAIQAIEQDLKWLGIKTDEGPSSTIEGNYGPYIQSERIQLYQENIKSLIDSGHAYECFCSETRLDLIRREAMKQRQTPRYDNKCRDLTRDQVKTKKVNGEQFCYRFKLQPEEIQFTDLIHGIVKFDLTDRNYEGDPVIVKSDGFPTYHFANVVDDHYMEISHVLRGIEWQVSTPKHLQLYRAFNWIPPEFGHLPIICNKDGTKLSKRQGDISIKHYRDSSYYANALTNFVTKSGGGFADHSVEHIYSNEELAQLFDLSKVNTNACKLDFLLLLQLNQLELQKRVKNDFQSLLSSMTHYIQKEKDQNPSSTFNTNTFSESYLETILKWCPDRVNTLKDLFTPPFSYLWSNPSPQSLSKVSNSLEILVPFLSEWEKLTSDSKSNESFDISAFIQNYAQKNGLKFKSLMKDVRLILCGLEKGPPIADLVLLFGAKNTINRLNQGIHHLETIKQHQKTMTS